MTVDEMTEDLTLQQLQDQHDRQLQEEFPGLKITRRRTDDGGQLHEFAGHDWCEGSSMEFGPKLKHIVLRGPWVEKMTPEQCQEMGDRITAAITTVLDRQDARRAGRQHEKAC